MRRRIVIAAVFVVAIGWYAFVYANVDHWVALAVQEEWRDSCQELVTSIEFCSCFAERQYQQEIAPIIEVNRFSIALTYATFSLIKLPDSLTSQLEIATGGIGAGHVLDWSLGCIVNP
jgi:hypothetical protein